MLTSITVVGGSSEASVAPPSTSVRGKILTSLREHVLHLHRRVACIMVSRPCRPRGNVHRAARPLALSFFLRSQWFVGDTGFTQCFRRDASEKAYYLRRTIVSRMNYQTTKGGKKAPGQSCVKKSAWLQFISLAGLAKYMQSPDRTPL